MQYFGASVIAFLSLANSLQCTKVNGEHNALSSSGPRVKLDIHPHIANLPDRSPSKRLLVHRHNEALNMTCTVVYKNGDKEDDEGLDYTVDWKEPRQAKNNPKHGDVSTGQSRNMAWIRFERVTERDTGDYTCIAVSNKSPQSTLTVSLHLFVKHERLCGAKWFKCRSEHCIMQRYVCDGKPDCEDGEDESMDIAGCDANPCAGKMRCEDRCLAPELCCDHHNCNGSYDLRSYSHENHEISYVQTAFYTVIGCAMAFMFIVTILVIAICRVQIKRAMNSRCSQPNRIPCARRSVPLYDLDVYLNRTTDVNYPGGVSIMYNINSGVQYVGRPAEPPPYSEVIAEPPREGPPPPYMSCENLIVRQANPRFIETEIATAINTFAPTVSLVNLPDDAVNNQSDTDIRTVESSEDAIDSQNFVPNVPGPQVASCQTSVFQALGTNCDGNMTACRTNSLQSRDSVDAPLVRVGSRRMSAYEYLETDALLSGNSNVPGIHSAKTIAWKPYSRHALMKSRWLNSDRNDKVMDKHWYRQRIEKAAETSSLKDSENEGVFLETDQQETSTCIESAPSEIDVAAGFSSAFVNMTKTQKESETSDKSVVPSCSSSNEASSSHTRDTKLTDYRKNSEVSSGKKLRISEGKLSSDDQTKIDKTSERISQTSADTSFNQVVKRQSSISHDEIRPKNLNESSASEVVEANSQTRDASSLVLPLRESFIGVQRDS